MRKGPLRSHTLTALELRLECTPWTEGHGRADNRAMAYSTRNVFWVRYRDPSDFTKTDHASWSFRHFCPDLRVCRHVADVLSIEPRAPGHRLASDAAR